MANKKVNKLLKSECVLEILLNISSEGEMIADSDKNKKVKHRKKSTPTASIEIFSIFDEYSEGTINNSLKELIKAKLIKRKQFKDAPGKPRVYYSNDKEFMNFIKDYLKKRYLRQFYDTKKILVDDKPVEINGKKMDFLLNKDKKKIIESEEAIDRFFKSVIFEKICFEALWSGCQNLTQVIHNVVTIILNIQINKKNINSSNKQLVDDLLVVKKELGKTNIMKIDLRKYEMDIEDFLSGNTNFLPM